MKYPEWYNTNNVLGFYLLAGLINPNGTDKRLWTKTETFKVILIDFLVVVLIGIIII